MTLRDAPFGTLAHGDGSVFVLYFDFKAVSIERGTRASLEETPPTLIGRNGLIYKYEIGNTANNFGDRTVRGLTVVLHTFTDCGVTGRCRCPPPLEGSTLQALSTVCANFTPLGLITNQL